MYQSRLHATNGLVSIALDARSGEILEFVNERSGDNVIKSNCSPRAWMPFAAEMETADGKKIMGRPPRYAEILEHAELQADIEIERQDDRAEIRVRYKGIVFGSEILPVRVETKIVLPANDVRSVWTAKIIPDGEHELEKFYFPMLNGLWLGDTWEDDTLVYPMNAGEKFENPVRVLAAKPQMVYWKWQEYNYGYIVNGAANVVADERGSHVRETAYSGPASMLWMDLFDRTENTGIYLTCRNDGFLLKTLRAETFGEEEPGMGLSIGHVIYAKTGEVELDPCVFALHDGDWHWGADEYRAWRESIADPAPRRHRPEWFEKSPGLVAHYDFKYQTQGICHRYKDIPALLGQAREMGLDHLLISGWNYDGFDNGFPQYRTDPELGTEEELREAVHKVREAGGHLAFYINSRLCNTKYADREKTIRDCAVMRRDGKLNIEKYGAKDLTFACLCNQASEWRDEFCGVVDYLTHDIGADSMYLDQMAMAPGQPCFHPAHSEHAGHPDRWNIGYRRMLNRMRDRYDEGGMAMLYEGCSDIHGWGVSGQLISTMFFPNAYPEMYKYTFPEQILVDMMNPRRNSGMRAEHVARSSTMLLHRAFVCGSYLWVYDLENDNTFRRDPEQMERLRRIIALRRAWLEAYGQGRFVDTRDIACVPEGIICKQYEIGGDVLIACSNRKPVPEPYFLFAAPVDGLKAAARTFSHPDEEIGIPVEAVRNMTLIRLPEKEELSVIILRKG